MQNLEGISIPNVSTNNLFLWAINKCRPNADLDDKLIIANLLVNNSVLLKAY